MSDPINIGTRRELFVDDFLIDRLDRTRLVPHRPREMPASAAPLAGGHGGAYVTVIKDGDRYRAYYRAARASGDVVGDGGAGEVTCYEESADGMDWVKPELGLFEIGGSRANNVILAEPPFCHNFSPFLDVRPGAPETERYKALAGMGLNFSGLFAFVSADGIRWRRAGDRAAIPYNPHLHGPNAFDSQNVSFWSEAERCYVAYFRHMKTPEGVLRTVSRATSDDFVNWRDESATFQSPNFPGEELYTNQTHPYFRAPHIYIALPTRFTHGLLGGQPVEHEAERWGRGNIGSTDVMLMTTRAGANAYRRTVQEAFIRPGLDPARWKNRANYMALNIVPTGPREMSLYHAMNGRRYVLRTDGFVSVNAPWAGGELLTKPLVFNGRELAINYSTSIAGPITVELQDAAGVPIPGYTLDDCPGIIGDAIERVVVWKSGGDLSHLAGRPVRLRFVLKDADIFSLQFKGK